MGIGGNRLATALLLAAGVGLGWADAASLSGEVSLVLEDAVFQVRKEGTTGPPTYLELDLLCRDGQWREDVYGWALNLNRSDSDGKLLKAAVEGGQIHLDTRMEIDGDPWVLGGTPSTPSI